MPRGRRLKGAPNRDKMWDNFARLTARQAKSRVLFNNLTIYLDFSAIFSRIVPNRPLNEWRPLGATFCRRGSTSWLSLQRYATELGSHFGPIVCQSSLVQCCKNFTSLCSGRSRSTNLTPAAKWVWAPVTIPLTLIKQRWTRTLQV